MNDKEIIVAIGETRWISENNFKTLCKYARLVPENGVILEIGSGPGTSISALALASKESVRLYGVDLAIPKEPHRGIMERVKELHLEGKVFLAMGGAQEVGKRWNLNIDLLFHDGIHSYQAVLDDSTLYHKFLKKNGYILWHDYELYRNSVGKGIDEFMKDHPRYKKVEITNNIYVAKKEE